MTPSQAFEMLYDGICTQMLLLLRQSGRHFGILCDESKVRFEPPQAREQATQIGRMYEFMISGSTFDSFEITQDSLGQTYANFIAGLTPGGMERVSVRIRGIYQIFIKDTQNEDCELFTRVDSGFIFAKSESKEPQAEQNLSEQEQHSLEMIFAQKHNQKVLDNLATYQHKD